MKKLFNRIKNIFSQNKSQLDKEKGATMVEYAIMVALIAVVSVAIVRSLGTTVSTQFNSVNVALG